jgi:glucose-6-phosphate 1-dehydrogenase
LETLNALGGSLPPYERLLGDAIRGDALLFAREDNVAAAWRVVDPVPARRDAGPCV